MKFEAIVALLFSLFGVYAGDKATLDATGTVSTPQHIVGSENGKPLYAKVVLSTTKDA